MDDLEAQRQPAITFDVATDEAGTAIVTLGGELDMNSIDALETAAGPALAARPKRLIVDVGGLRFADSSAIALWVRWAGTVSQFELRNPSPLLRRVITAMGLAQKLEPKP